MKRTISLQSLLALCLTLTLTNGCAAQGGSFFGQSPSAQNVSTTANPQDGVAHPALLDPSKATEQAPENFKVKVETTKGDFVISIAREASPNGVDRFYNLVKIGYFKDIAIFRAVNGFMFQFGIHGDPAVSDKWAEANINDDANVGVSNVPGTICFAKTGAPNSRSTQMFINLGNNSFLDDQGFTPFGKVTEGLEVVGKINTEYGENKGDVQGEFKQKGNQYILKKFPNIDLIKSVTIVE